MACAPAAQNQRLSSADMHSLLNDIMTREYNEEQWENVLKLAAEPNTDPHFLLLGRPAVGKSTFGGKITEGEIKGSSGPDSGTKSSEVPVGPSQWKHIKTVKIEGAVSAGGSAAPHEKKAAAYYVHDTVGLGEKNVNLEEMKREARECCEQNKHSTIFLCICWDDRIGSLETQMAFEVCHSLNKWEEVIVVITKCDLIAHSPDRKSRDEIKNEWEDKIRDQLTEMGVEVKDVNRIVETMVLFPGEQHDTTGIQLLRALRGVCHSALSKGADVQAGALALGRYLGCDLCLDKFMSQTTHNPEHQPEAEVENVKQKNQNIGDEKVDRRARVLLGGAVGGVAGAAIGGVGLGGLCTLGVSTYSASALLLAVGGGVVCGGVVGLVIGAAIMAYLYYK